MLTHIVFIYFRAAKEVKKTQKATKKFAATKAKPTKPTQKATKRVGGKRKAGSKYNFRKAPQY